MDEVEKLDQDNATSVTEIENEKATDKLETDQETSDSKEFCTFLKPDDVKPLRKKSCKTTSTDSRNEDHINLEDREKSYVQNNEVKVRQEKSPSQRVLEKMVAIPYKEPTWSGLPPSNYAFEVIKNGVVLENIPFNKPFLVVGRLANCDIIMEHPSISRFHCIVQYRANENGEETPGVYVYDLESTHGTFLNKYRVKPKVYNRLKVGHIIKFGGSSRMFILQGPDEDQEPESQFSVTELKALANEKKFKLEKLESGESDGKSNGSIVKIDDDSEGIDWGMGEDAVEDEEEESDSFQNPFASNEELFLNDPKKTLRGWYEREGYDFPEYKVEEIQPGCFKGSLELPVSGSGGKPILCVVQHRGKKKEAVVQCALEACRVLDRHGLLRQSTHESHERKQKNWSENDYYDSDEDDFLDRTGDIEKKRNRRKREVGIGSQVETYDTLKKKYEEVIASMEKIEGELKLADSSKMEEERVKADSSSFETDELDSYMNHLSSRVPDKHKIIDRKMELVKLRKEEVRLRRLINVARPVGVLELAERNQLIMDTRPGTLKITKEEKTLKRKPSGLQRVHQAFLEDDEEERPKLRKINCDDDDDDGLLPVPYDNPKKMITKYKLSGVDRKGVRPQIGSSPLPNPKVCSSQEVTEISELASSSERTEPEVLAESKTSDEGQLGEVSISGVSGEDEVHTNDTDGNDPSVSEKYVIGPSLPPPNKLLEFSKPFRKSTKVKEKKSKVPKNCFDFEGNYETWVPPSNQTGDGRTSLNDKLGY